MRLSCDPILFFRHMVLEKTMSLEQWFDLAQELELDGIEIQHNCLTGYEPSYLEGLRAGLAARRLAVSQFIGSPDFSHPQADHTRGGSGADHEAHRYGGLLWCPLPAPDCRAAPPGDQP
jgi:hypothetical protein